MARRGNVVVVTLNYRLGLFGYLRGIALCGETLASTGNEGLLDQLAALRWVQDEISPFGGDPENVTVVGQSARARSIAALAGGHGDALLGECLHEGRRLGYPSIHQLDEQKARLMIGARKTVADQLRRAVSQQ